MTIFSELYGAYYNAVAAILSAAVDHPLAKGEPGRLIAEHAFGESVLSIEPALASQQWMLLHPDGTTPLRHKPTMPLTTLQKRWLAAIALDPRIKLFGDDIIPEMPGVEPLFAPEDISVYDKYSDGDPYDDPEYISRFRLILGAIARRQPLSVETLNRKGNNVTLTVMPEKLEYSEKDDKFRLIGSDSRGGAVFNLARMISCRLYEGSIAPDDCRPPAKERRYVTFELYDRRNALERVMMHFAHFEKQAEKTGDSDYLVTVAYDRDDENELVIRLLSFGPMVKVVGPDGFVELMRGRLLRQSGVRE